MSDNTKAQVTLRADDLPMRQTLKDMLGRFREFGDGAKKSMGDVRESAGSLRGALVGVASALSVGLFANFLRQTVDLQDQMSKAAQKAGVTTEQFSGMNYAAQIAAVSTEQLTKTYAKLNGTLIAGQQGQRDAVELFRRLKLDPANIKDADALLLTLAERFASMNDGAEKTTLAIDWFGEKLGPGLVPFLNQGRAGIQALREEAQRLGVVISTEAGKQAEEFNDNLTRTGVAARGAANEILKGLLPSLTSASTFFVKATQDAGLFRGTLISIGALMAKGLGVDDTGRVVTRINAFNRETERLKKQLADIEIILQRDPGDEGAQRRYRLLTEQMRLVAQASAKAVAELNALEPMTSPTLAPPKPAGFSPLPKPATGSAKPRKEESFMPYYEEMLSEEKLVWATLNEGREYTKQQELQFWQFLADNAKLSADEDIAIWRKTAALEIDIARKTAQDRSQIDADSAATAEKFALGRVDAEAAAARTALELGQLTKAQLAGLEVQFEQQRFAIQASALQQRLALLAQDPTLNAVALARVQNELLLLEQQHQIKRQQLLGQQQAQEGSFGNLLTEMVGSEQSWNNLFNGLIQRTLTWQQAMSNIFGSVGQAFLNEFITKTVAGQAKGLATMLAQQLGFLGASTAAQGTASGAVIATKTVEATAVSTANAVEAGTGAAAAVAPIPIVGPALALAAMGAVFAAVMALAGSAKSARGGYNIPAGVNPMTQLHEEEMVLPSDIANPLRRMVAGGSGQGAAPINVSMQVVTPDAESFRASGDRITGELHRRLADLRRGI